MCIRELDFTDAQPLLGWLQNEEARQWLVGDAATLTREDIERFILSAQICAGDCYWAIMDAQGRFQGLVSLQHLDEQQAWAEFSIGLLPSARGQGLARQAAQAVLCLAFNELGLREIYMATRADNTATLEFNRRCGFQPLPAPPADFPRQPVDSPLSWFVAYQAPN